MAGIVGIRRLGYDEFAFIRRGTVLSVYELPVVKRGFFVVLVDLVVAFAAAYVAVGLKTDDWLLSAVRGQVIEIATTLAPVTALVFSWQGMYRGSWRVAGLQDLTRVVVAVAVATAAGAFLVRVFSSNDYPLSLFGIYGVVSLLMTVSIRASYVILASSVQRSSRHGVPVLIYGAGRRGAAAARELFQNQGLNLRPVGFIDDDWQMRGMIVAGLPVLGTGRDMEHALRDTAASGVVISSHRITKERLERAAEACRERHGNLFHLHLGIRRADEEEAGGVTPAAETRPDPLHAADRRTVCRPGRRCRARLAAVSVVQGLARAPLESPQSLRALQEEPDRPPIVSLRGMRVAGVAHPAGVRGADADRRSIPARFAFPHTAVSATAALIHGRHPWSPPRVGLTGPARALLVAGIAWGAFAFGAVYPWAYWPLAIAAAAVALAGLATPAAIGWRTLDLTAVTLALAIFLVAAAAQLVPLPAATIDAISPETPSIVAQLDLTAQLDPASARPLTIDPARTRRGLVVVASLAALIVGAARLFSIVGAAGTASAIVVLGVLLALTGIVQRPLFTGKIYGFWTPLQGGSPFGPFVNKNHFAGWMLMAIPVAIGLICNDVSRGLRGVRPVWRERVLWLSSPDASRLLLLMGAAAVMTLSLFLTMSRSGMAAGALAAVCVVTRLTPG